MWINDTLGKFPDLSLYAASIGKFWFEIFKIADHDALLKCDLECFSKIQGIPWLIKYWFK